MVIDGGGGEHLPVKPKHEKAVHLLPPHRPCDGGVVGGAEDAAALLPVICLVGGGLHDLVELAAGAA